MVYSFTIEVSDKTLGFFPLCIQFMPNTAGQSVKETIDWMWGNNNHEEKKIILFKDECILGMF